MTEDEAIELLERRFDVSRETLERIGEFIAMLRCENERQNLVSGSSLEHIWTRHILDSAQLIEFTPRNENWLDLGTGAGFPGLIVSLLRRSMTILVDERKLRCAFLERAAEAMAIASHTKVMCSRVETVPAGRCDVISARAFAPLPRLLALGERFADADTIWVLPKGRNAKSELDAALASWQGEFRLEPSLTDPDAAIIVAEKVRRRPTGKRR